eukprot:323749-Rhodomonas_salina.1
MLSALENSSHTRWLLRLLQALITLLVGGTFVLHFDNQGAVYLLGGVVRDHPDKIFGGSSKAELQALVISILDLAALHNVTLLAIWVPRKLNIRADTDSHVNELDYYDYMVKPDLFASLDREWGPHTVDCFASAANAQLPRFNSKWFQKEAEWIDAFSISWKGENNWVFPPPAIIPHVVRHLRRSKAEAMLIIPAWSGAHWWPTLFPNGHSSSPAQFVLKIKDLGEAQQALTILFDSRNQMPPTVIAVAPSPSSPDDSRSPWSSISPDDALRIIFHSLDHLRALPLVSHSKVLSLSLSR